MGAAVQMKAAQRNRRPLLTVAALRVRLWIGAPDPARRGRAARSTLHWGRQARAAFRDAHRLPEDAGGAHLGHWILVWHTKAAEGRPEIGGRRGEKHRGRPDLVQPWRETLCASRLCVEE